MLFDELVRMFVPRLLNSVVEQIPLPDFDIGGLAGLPDDEVWQLTNGGMDRTDGHYRLTGRLN